MYAFTSIAPATPQTPHSTLAVNSMHSRFSREIYCFRCCSAHTQNELRFPWFLWMPYEINGTPVQCIREAETEIVYFFVFSSTNATLWALPRQRLSLLYIASLVRTERKKSLFPLTANSMVKLTEKKSFLLFGRCRLSFAFFCSESKRLRFIYCFQMSSSHSTFNGISDECVFLLYDRDWDEMWVFSLWFMARYLPPSAPVSLSISHCLFRR